MSDLEKEWLHAQFLNEYMAMNYPSGLVIIAREDGSDKNGSNYLYSQFDLKEGSCHRFMSNLVGQSSGSRHREY